MVAFFFFFFIITLQDVVRKRLFQVFFEQCHVLMKDEVVQAVCLLEGLDLGIV